MKYLISIFQQSFISKEFERTALLNDKQTLVGMIHLIVFATCMIGGTVMYFYDINSFLSLFLMGFVCFLGGSVNRAGHPTSAAVILIAALLVVIQFNIFAGFGIHDVAIIAWPAFIFFSGVLFSLRVIPYFTALIMVLAVVTKLFPNGQFFSNYSDTGDLIVMQLILLTFGVIAMLILRRNEHLLQHLQQSEERFQAIYNSINDAILIQDPQTGTILDVNAKTLEMFGYTRQEVALLDILALSSCIPSYPHENALERIRKAVTQSAQQFEWQAKDKCGRVFWVDVHMKRATIAKQDQVLVSIRDITDRKRAEEALEESREKYRGLSEASFEAIFISDKGICLEQNQMAERMFGYSDAEAIGRYGTEWISAEDRDTVLNNMLSGYDKPYEVTALRKDGSTFPAIIRGKMMHYKDRTVRVTSLSDITARKQAETALQESENTLRRAQEIAHIGHFKFNPATGIVEGSDELFRIFGLTREQFQFSDFVNSVHPADRASDLAFVESAIARKTDYEHEHRLLLPGGTLKWIRMIGTFPTAVPNEPALIIGTVQDITERKHAEAALCESEERMKEAQRMAHIGSWELNLVNNQLIGSEEIYRIFEINPAKYDASYEAFLDAIHPADRETVDRAYTASHETRNPYESDHRLLMPDGRVKYVHERCETFYDAEGHPLRSMGTVQDITERQRTEEALLSLKRSIDQSIGGIARADMNGTIVFANKAWARMHGYETNEVIDKPLSMFHTQEQMAYEVNPFNQNVIDHGAYAAEIGHARKDGTTFVTLMEATVVRDSQQQPIELIGSAIDITERKKAEAKIRATLDEKETLLREVHHRVKNNLQAMIALMEMQANLIPDEDTRLFLKELEGQARTMSLVYEQLYQSVNLAHVQMAPYLQQLTFNIVEMFGGPRKVQLNLDVAPITLDVAQAMPCGLIVNELVTNILKHAFPPEFQGPLTIHITLQDDGDSYRLTVADNGVGLPPGYDWHASRSLGLRLVNLWVTHQLGGTLNVSGEPGATYAISFRSTTGETS